jgi:GDP-L-fucose synthase
MTKDNMDINSKIYVAGHRGVVGSAITRLLQSKGYNNLLFRTSKELDLRNQQEVDHFFEKEKPQFVFLAAAKVGGIMANNIYRGEFIYENMEVQNNVIHHAWKNGVEKLMFLGSSCIYPKLCPQPIKEEYLLTGLLEPTNEPYAIAKIAGIKMCDAYRSQYGCNFISIMPTNLYGPNDNYDLNNSHVLPALIRKFHEAKLNNEPFVSLWGTGSPRREFLHSDDMAGACLFLMQHYNEPGIINVGTGEDITISQLADLMQDITGYKGEIHWDSSKPDGTPRKLMDVSKLNNLGWRYTIPLRKGIEQVYANIQQFGFEYKEKKTFNL